MTPFAEGALLHAAQDALPVELDELVSHGALVLVPHPDDETLACGAALSALVASRRSAHVVVVTDGGRSHPKSPSWSPARIAARRKHELADALSVLGGGGITHECLGYPDQGSPVLDVAGIGQVLGRLATTMKARDLDTIWTTWEGDPHSDHQQCALLAEALAAGFSELTGSRPRLLRCPVWGRFIGTPLITPEDELLCYRPDESQRRIKRRAVAKHASQMSGLIDDDPDGFIMPAEMQAHFIDHDELFIRRCPS